MTFDWEDVYQTSDQEDLQSDAYYNEQTYYVTAGETASLIARYRQTHSFSDVKLYTAQGYVSGGSDNPTTAATGLVLDGPDFVLRQRALARQIGEHRGAMPCRSPSMWFTAMITAMSMS